MNTAKMIGKVAILALGCSAFANAQGPDDLSVAVRELHRLVLDLNARLQRLEAGDSAKKPPVDPPSLAAKLLSAQAAFANGRAAEERSDWTAAGQLYTTAVGLDPRMDVAFVRRAGVHLEEGRLEQALADANQALAIQKHNSAAYAMRAKVRIARREFPEAIADIEEALLRDAANPNYQALRSALQQAPPQPPKLAEPADSAQEADAGSEPSEQVSPAPPPPVNPREAQASLQRGRQLVNEGKLTEALAQLEQAVSLDPNPVAYNSRGFARLLQRNYAAAIEDFTQAIALNPSYANAHLNRAAARRDSGDAAGAKQDFMTAWQLSRAGSP